MTFDEQLQRAFDALSAQARTERDAAVAEASSRARTEAEQSADVRLQAAVTEAATRAREDAEAAAREETARIEQHAQEMIEAAAATTREQLRSADLAASERLLDAVRTLDRARSLSEILDALVSCAGREAARVGLLLTRHGELRGWRFIGFDPTFEPASAIVIRPEDSGIVGEAMRTRTAISSDTSGAFAAPALVQLPSGRQSLAVPVTMSDEVVAVLYADQGVADEEGRLPPALTWPDTLELIARHAARCLEAATAITAVRVLTARPEIPPSASSTPPADAGLAGAGRSNGPPSGGDTEDAARRYARLLVSEIKMYHEAAVLAGRRDRNLGTRLSVEIARARVLYEQRISPEARGSADYFHDELVQTLANGDASLLELRT